MIVKSSELTRTGREGGRRVRDEGGGLPWVVFLAMKSRSQGPEGRKVQKSSQENGQRKPRPSGC